MFMGFHGRGPQILICSNLGAFAETELAVTAQNDRLAMSAEYRSWVAALITLMMPHAHPLLEFAWTNHWESLDTTWMEQHAVGTCWNMLELLEP